MPVKKQGKLCMAENLKKKTKLCVYIDTEIDENFQMTYIRTVRHHTHCVW